MIITITRIELKSPFHFFRLSWLAMNSVRQLRRNKASIGFKSTGFWKTHYTMSSWINLEELKKYAREGAHLDSMKASRFIASEIRTETYEGSGLPAWKEAKEKVRSGKVIYF